MQNTSRCILFLMNKSLNGVEDTFYGLAGQHFPYNGCPKMDDAAEASEGEISSTRPARTGLRKHGRRVPGRTWRRLSSSGSVLPKNMFALDLFLSTIISLYLL